MMNANEVVSAIIDKLNSKFEVLMGQPEIDGLIGNTITDEITTENYQTIVPEYLNAIAILTNAGKSLHPFLKKALIILSNLDSISSDITIMEEFKVCGVHRDLLKNIYIANNQITNQFLDENKLVLIETLHTNFEDFIISLKETDNTSQKLLYIAKAILDNFDFVLDDTIHRLIFLSNCSETDIQNYTENKNELVAYLKLCILSEGLTFHKHFDLQNATPTQNLACDTTKIYSQYNEILYILSEYNHSNDLLNKYFLLYTIIENFMYRKPIAQMLRDTAEFSIRDFKSFYSKIDSGELEKLKDLFKNIMDIQYPDGMTIFNHINSKLTDFKSNQNNDLSKLIAFLKKIRVYNKNFELDEAMLTSSLKDKYFAEIVYQLRNSTLHNTATEFHITHYELAKNQVIVDFIRDFMIPILEKIILYMIFSNHTLISYDKNTFSLYSTEYTEPIQ